jgi:hypothetical protein
MYIVRQYSREALVLPKKPLEMIPDLNVFGYPEGIIHPMRTG